MMQLLERFSEVVMNEPNLRPVLPQKEFIICFQYDDHFIYLELSPSNCRVFKYCQNRIDLWIKGKTEEIEMIISGRERLRKLESRSDMKVIGNFKDILAVETLFSLCEKKLSA